MIRGTQVDFLCQVHRRDTCSPKVL